MTDASTQGTANGNLIVAANTGGSAVLPDNFDFPPVDAAVSCTPQRVILRPDQNAAAFTSNNNPIIRFTLPSDAIYDFRNAVLSFAATVTATTYATTMPRINQFVQSLFQRVRVSWGGNTQCEDILNWNLITAIQKLSLQDNEWLAQVGTVLEGASPDGAVRFAEQDGAGTHTAQYVIPFNIGLLTEKPLPAKFINQPLVIEITMAQPNTCIENSTVGSVTNPVSLSNLQLRVVRLHCPAYDSMIQQKVAAGNFHWHYKSWDYFNWNMTGDHQEINIPTQAKCLEGVVAVMRTATSISNDDIMNKLTRYNQNLTQQYQMRWNGVMFPPEPVPCAASAYKVPYTEMLKFFNRWQPYLGGVNAPNMVGADFTRVPANGTEEALQKFMICVDFQAFDEEYRRLISGINAQGTNTNLQLIWDGDATDGAQVFDIFLLYSAICKISKDGTPSIVK